MILLIILFFVVGIIAIMFEAVLPFGISALFGFAIIAVSVYIAYIEFGLNLAILYCMMSLSVALLVTRLVLRSGLAWLTLPPPKSPKKPGLTPASAKPELKIGDQGVVVAPLRPTGTIEASGIRVSARCLSPEIEIPIGTPVRLVSRDSIYWIVEQISNGDAPGK